MNSPDDSDCEVIDVIRVTSPPVTSLSSSPFQTRFKLVGSSRPPSPLFSFPAGSAMEEEQTKPQGETKEAEQVELAEMEDQENSIWMADESKKEKEKTQSDLLEATASKVARKRKKDECQVDNGGVEVVSEERGNKQSRSQYINSPNDTADKTSLLPYGQATVADASNLSSVSSSVDPSSFSSSSSSSFSSSSSSSSSPFCSISAVDDGSFPRLSARSVYRQVVSCIEQLKNEVADDDQERIRSINVDVMNSAGRSDSNLVVNSYQHQGVMEALENTATFLRQLDCIARNQVRPSSSTTSTAVSSSLSPSTSSISFSSRSTWIVPVCFSPSLPSSATLSIPLPSSFPSPLPLVIRSNSHDDVNENEMYEINSVGRMNGNNRVDGGNQELVASDQKKAELGGKLSKLHRFKLIKALSRIATLFCMIAALSSLCFLAVLVLPFPLPCPSPFLLSPPSSALVVDPLHSLIVNCHSLREWRADVQLDFHNLLQTSFLQSWWNSNGMECEEGDVREVKCLTTWLPTAALHFPFFSPFHIDSVWDAKHSNWSDYE